jgi:hypothetical protein
MEMRIFGRTGMKLSFGGRDQGPTAERRVRPHCRCRGDVVGRQLGATAPRSGRHFPSAQRDYRGRWREELSVRQVLGDVVPAFERLRQQGKTRFLGLTAIGDTTAFHQVIDARAFDSAQVVYNMLNPSAANELPPNYPAQDYGRLFNHTKAAGVGVVFLN